VKVGVGYSDNPDTRMGGIQAAKSALNEGQTSKPCNLALLFSTTAHDAGILREAVASILGPNIPIVGGAAVGAITNDHFGYAGTQIILATMWLDDNVDCQIFYEGEIDKSEFTTGQRLGQKLLKAGVTPETPILLFYDSITRTPESMRLNMATTLLWGIEDTLGFTPHLAGAGLQGDYAASMTKQWIGHEVVQHHALAIVFTGQIQMDCVIMHGCKPATGYYTVTKSDLQTILEINDQPALSFIKNLLGPAISQEEYPFFLIFGINKSDKFGPFAEKSYASRLCLAIDPSRDGIVMFEPDMIEGTEFQIMLRAMDYDYMPPRIEKLFSNLNCRQPVFCLYIDCAGRAGAYAGSDLEDAEVVQNSIAKRAPLLGMYSGVEIARVEEELRGLDWTGVFCLFSVPK
jgi:hypothetical protein